jgi:hypothetical protein
LSRVPYGLGTEDFPSFGHGLNRKASTILLFVSGRQGLPSSILDRVGNDTPAFLASSDLLIINVSLTALSGFSVGILTTPFQLLCIIIFTVIYCCYKIHTIIALNLEPKVLGKDKESTPRYRPLSQSRHVPITEYPMRDAFDSFEKPPLGVFRERRKYNRTACSIKANYLVKGRWHKGSIQNISDGGAYILTFEDEVSSPGEGIFLVARIRFLPEQLRGRIAWMDSYGMGVEFQSAECI